MLYRKIPIIIAGLIFGFFLGLLLGGVYFRRAAMLLQGILRFKNG